MSATCPNLKKLFGLEYVIRREEACENRADPWAFVIPCRGGVVIYPQGETTLAVECDYHSGLARKLAAIHGVRLHQDGDKEKTFLFDLALFNSVAALVKPKRRRRLSPERREASIARLATYRASR